jgi:hypothetical protein
MDAKCSGDLPVLVLGCWIGAALNEELRDIEMTPFGCTMQRSLPVLVLGWRVGAVLDEDPYEIQMIPAGRRMEFIRRCPGLAGRRRAQ